MQAFFFAAARSLRASVHHGHMLLIALALLVVAVVISLSFPKELVFADIGNVAQPYQVYYFDDGYSEANSLVLSGQHHFQGDDMFHSGLAFPGNATTKFRLDFNGEKPADVVGFIAVKKTLFRTTYRYYGQAAIVGTQGVSASGTLYKPVSADPYLEVDLSKGEARSVQRWSWEFVFGFLFVWLALITARSVWRLSKSEAVLPMLAFACVMACVGGLILSLGLNHGPDEEMHYRSFYWYFENLRPPSLYFDDSLYLNPIWQSNYILGASGDISYLLTARLSGLLSWLRPSLDTLHSLRIAQFFLILAGLGLCAEYLGKPTAVAYMLCWAVIPQLSYTATYLNGDVLSFVMGFIAFAVAVDTIQKKNFPVALAAILFLLFNSKSNYLALVLVLPVLWLFSGPDFRTIRAKAVIGLILVSPLILYRRLFNMGDQSLAGTTYLSKAHERVLQTDVSQYPFSYVKASYERTMAGLAQFDWSVATDPNWYRLSLKSFFGVFGFMDFYVPTFIVAFSGLAFLLVVRMALPGKRNKCLLIAGLVLTVVASLYYSISQGPQPQGRYLFPFICVAFVLARDNIKKHVGLLSFSALPAIASLSLFR